MKATSSDNGEHTRARGGLSERAELFATVLLALAAVMTAWAAFQSSKWTGVQADSYSRASAARVESTRASNEAGQLTAIDVTAFTAWVDAIAAERRAGRNTGPEPSGEYVPQSGTQSGFLYERFRDEFLPAFDAWISTDPLNNPAAPKTPFAMPEYEPEALSRSVELEQRADDFAAQARTANANGDQYVLMTIVFAAVLFFAGLSSKAQSPRVRSALLGAAVVVFGVAAVVILTFPKEL